MQTKQVIILRSDLNMPKGKLVAQGSHGSNHFLYKIVMGLAVLTDVQKDWLENSHTKITLKVKSEAELDLIYEKALELGLEANMVIDNGLTMFNGVKTKTCVCIGPDESMKIDMVTKDLGLL